MAFGNTTDVHAIADESIRGKRLTTQVDEDPFVPLVCGSCSHVALVTLSVLHESKSIECRDCGNLWDAAAISATVPSRILRPDAGHSPTARPLSEFP